MNNVDNKINNTFENQEKNKFKEMEQEITILKHQLEEKNWVVKEKDLKINKLMRKLDNVIEENSILKEKSNNIIKLKEKEKEIDHGLFRRRNAIFFKREEEKDTESYDNSAYIEEFAQPQILRIYQETMDINPDNMTFEQLLELEERMGNVSKGLNKKDLDKIPLIKFNSIEENNGLIKCTVCQFEFNIGDDLRKLSCSHIYHKNCVDEWLLNEKKCPICNIEVKV